MRRSPGWVWGAASRGLTPRPARAPLVDPGLVDGTAFKDPRRLACSWSRSGRRRLELGQLQVAQVDDVVAELTVQQLELLAGHENGRVAAARAGHHGPLLPRPGRWTGLGPGSPPPPAPPRTERPASSGPSDPRPRGRRLTLGGAGRS